MVIAKVNPVGLDATINYMQKVLFEKLNAKWNTDITVYPRCYVNVREEEGKLYKIIEHYNDNDEYTNVIAAEVNKCFFVKTADVTPKNLQDYETEVALYFTVDLSAVKPTITHRADEEVHNDVLEIISKFGNVTFNRLVTEIQKVYSGLDYTTNDDHQPYHCFKIEMDIYYNPKDKACP